MPDIPTAPLVHHPSRPLVSFIVTYYNRPLAVLVRCLRSVVAVDPDGAWSELLLIDDGSAVSPMSQLDEALARRVTYVRKPNGGLSDARNAGLDRARGEYVQFVDDDDCLIPASYSHCVALAARRCYDMVLFHADDRPDRAPSVPADTAYDSGAIYMSCVSVRPVAWGYLFRREALSKLRFTCGIYHEDEEFTSLLLLRAGPVVETSARAYYYDVHPGSIITRTDRAATDKRLADTLYVIDSLATQLERQQPGVCRQALERRIDQLVMAYLYNIVVRTRSLRRLRSALRQLRDRRLYPLRVRPYTKRYLWFSRLVNAPLGWLLLLLLIPPRRSV